LSQTTPQADLALPSEAQSSTGKWARVFFLLSRLFLGGIFVYASYDKILHPVPFAEIVYNYQILPDLLVNLVSLFLPWIELLVGLSLILGIWLPGSVLICAFLLVVFFSTLVFNMSRGLDIDCGCFTTSIGSSSGGHMLWYLVRDGFFLFVALFLFFSFFILNTPSNPSFDRSRKRTVGQTVVLSLIAVLLGLIVNQVRSDSIPLLGDWSPEARITLKFGKNILIPFDEAREKFFNSEAVFVDARIPELYQEGHIPGALSVPLAEFDEMIDKVLTELPEEGLIVTYCDGEDCDLSAHLALKLKEIGYKNVRVLHNGWSAWKNHQLPFQRGTEQEG
jgi:rhodanese-related sulfurtransferase/uncharacterized membrane protein YphA (DoxX/SURF4 family)